MNTFKKIWNIVSTVLVVLMVLCAVFLLGSRLIGYQCFTVISGSMAPKYNVGDLIYVKDVNVNTIQVGDDITFLLNDELDIATHRVVRIDTEKQQFYTKGLTNNTIDDPVHFNNVIGVPQFSIPLLGYVSNFVQHPPGSYITLIVGALLILAVFLPDMITFKKKEEEPEDPSSRIDAAEEENKRLKEELEKLREEMAKKEAE
jgi:signal peptidase